MKKMNKSYLLAGLLCTFLIGTTAENAWAQKLSGIPGSFVDIGFGARPVGLGSAFTGVADDEHSVYWNPAGLASISNYMTSFTHTNQLRLVEYNYMALASPIPGANHGAGLSVISSGDNAMRELSVHLGYAYAYGPISAGVGLKYRNTTFGKNFLNDSDYIIFEPDEINQGRMNQITGDGSGFGLDIGLLYRPNDRVGFGLVLRDAVSQFTWNSANQNPDRPAKGNYSENMPMELVFGTSYYARENLLVTTDFRPSMHSDTDNVFNIGAEITFIEMLALRAGTEQRVNDLSDEKYALGVGLLSPSLAGFKVRIDYTYLFEELNNTQRISLAIHF